MANIIFVKISSVKGSCFKSLVCVALLLACNCYSQAEPHNKVERWREIFLGGQKIGYNLDVRQQLNGEVVTSSTQTMLTKQRMQKPVMIEEVLEFRETVDGKPISLSATTRVPNANNTVTASIRAGKLKLRYGDAKKASRTSYKIPNNFMLVEGLRLSLLALSKTKSARDGHIVERDYAGWSFSRSRFDDMRVTLKAASEADRNGTQGLLWELNQYVKQDDGSYRFNFRYFADSKFNTVRVESSYLDEPLVSVVSNAASAKARFKPYDHLASQLIVSPFRISAVQRKKHIRYTLKPSSNFNLNVPTTSSQSIRWDGKLLKVDVCEGCGEELAPNQQALNQALADNRWLQSQEPKLKKVVKRLLKRDMSVHKKMLRLERFVKKHMTGEAQFVGYANALEAYESRVGDCTEFALLLASLGRSAGIPTRLVAGISYSSDRFHGKADVFVPHAWVQAWDGEQWRAYDSALDRIDSGNIVFGVYHGERGEFGRIMQQVQGIKITHAAGVRNKTIEK